MTPDNGDSVKKKTKTIKETLNPVWNENLKMLVEFFLIANLLYKLLLFEPKTNPKLKLTTCEFASVI